MDTLRAIYRNVTPAAIRRVISGARSRWRGICQESDLTETERRGMMRSAFSALHFNEISGDYAEFGCHTGRTFGLAYNASRKQNYNCKLWAFDSFSGLPPESVSEGWDEGLMKTSIEDFKKICRRRGIPESAYQIVPGFYEATLTAKEMAHQLPSVSLAYIDCILYSSTKTVLNFLAKRIKHGSIIAFDDYFSFSATTLAGERLACVEFLNAEPRFHFVPFWRYGWHGMAFIVEDKSYWKEIDFTVLP